MDIFYLELQVENIGKFESDECACGEAGLVEAVVLVAINLRCHGTGCNAAVESLRVGGNTQKKQYQ